MDANVYQIISYIGFGFAIIFLITAVILFFAFDIVALYGEVSGKTADKQVKAIREQNRRVSTRRREPEKSGRLEKSSKQIAKGIFESQEKGVTSPITQQMNMSTWKKDDAAESTVVLDGGETTVLTESEDTVVLNENTVVLSEDTLMLQNKNGIVLLEDEVEIHTDEVI